MTLQEHIAKEKDRLRKLLEDQKPLFLASQSALSEFSERVFDRGESKTGGTFTYNSTTPLYVNPATTFGNTSALKPPTGKTGKTVFASTGKPHKTTYVSSYKELRGKVGRENSKVNWEAFGDLKSEIENRSGGNMTPKKVNNQEYKISVTDSFHGKNPKGRNAGKLEGLDKKYPDVFKFSDSEKKTFNQVYNFEFLKLIRSQR